MGQSERKISKVFLSNQTCWMLAKQKVYGQRWWVRMQRKGEREEGLRRERWEWIG